MTDESVKKHPGDCELRHWRGRAERAEAQVEAVRAVAAELRARKATHGFDYGAGQTDAWNDGADEIDYALSSDAVVDAGGEMAGCGAQTWTTDHGTHLDWSVPRFCNLPQGHDGSHVYTRLARASSP